jgi:septum formation protein
MPDLILASTSPYRRQLLLRLGVAFECEAPGVDERAAAAGEPDPARRARLLARAKAEAVAARHPHAVVIGSDQVAEVDGAILGKPGTIAAAVDQLLLLQGREHRLITAVALATPDALVEFADIARLRMRRLDRAALERYVEADQPLDCCGSYKIEARGIGLFESVETADRTAITGLPLLRLTAELVRLGFRIR